MYSLDLMFFTFKLLKLNINCFKVLYTPSLSYNSGKKVKKKHNKEGNEE